MVANATWLCAFTLLGAAPVERRALVVIAVGEDAVLAGRLQQSLEQQLSGLPDYQVARAQDVAARFVAPALPEAPRDASLEGQRRALIEDARSAYYTADYPRSVRLLATARALAERDMQMSSAENLQLELLELALLLAEDRRHEASAAAGRLLMKHPAATVDTTIYRPSLRDFVEAARKELGALETVRIAGLPEHAVLRVDGRTVANPFQVFHGEHQLVVKAPGFRAAAVAGQLADMALPLALDVDLPIQHLLAALLWQSGATLDPRRTLSLLAERLGVVCVLAAGAAPDGTALRAVLACDAQPVRVSRTFRLTPLGEAELVSWLMDETRPRIAPEAASAARPVVAQTAVVAAVAQPTTGLTLAVGGSAVGLKASVGDADQSGVAARFVGAGSSLAVAFSTGMLRLQAEGQWQTLTLQRVALLLPDGTSAATDGGTGTALRFLSGIVMQPTRRIVALLGAGMHYQDHRADRVEFEEKNLGLFVSYRRLSAELHAQAEARLIEQWPLGDVVVRAAIAGAPWSNVWERPQQMTGTRLRYSWHVTSALALAWGNPWFVGIEGGLGYQSTQYDGASNIPVGAPLQQAFRRELSAVGRLWLGRAVAIE